MFDIMENNSKKNKKGKEKSFSFFSIIKISLFSYLLTYFLMSGGVNKILKQIDSNVPYKYSELSINEDEFNQIVSELESKFGVKIEENKKDEFLLLNSIYKNENLNDSDKDVFYGFFSIFKDFQDLNREEAYKSLSRVNVSRTVRDENTGDNTSGDYTYALSQINIYKIGDSENKILLHEGIHTIFNNDTTAKLPTYFKEGVTELMSNEYFSEDPFYENQNYPYEVAYAKLLCELVGSENVKKAFCTGDISIITNYLDKYNIDPTFNGKDLLTIYEDGFSHIEAKTPLHYNKNQQEKAISILTTIYGQAHPDYENFSEFNYLLGLSKCAFSEKPTQYYSSFLSYYGLLQKAYLSSDLMDKYSCIKIVKFNDRAKVKVKTLQERFN